MHAEVWPEVLGALRKAHIVGKCYVIYVFLASWSPGCLAHSPTNLVPDYSIHYFAAQNLLIAHMRYIGNDFEKDIAGIKDSEATRRWWKVRASKPASIRPWERVWLGARHVLSELGATYRELRLPSISRLRLCRGFIVVQSD